MMYRITSADEMQTLAGKLAACINNGAIIFLSGDLGAGKTAFVRGFLRQLGHEGKVKSPTYTLVEPYEVSGYHLFHFDFYRIERPEELINIGLHEYFLPSAICLVEWPEHALSLLPQPDLRCKIEFVKDGRQLHIEACTGKGAAILEKIIKFC